MPQSLAQIYLHLVFSTKEREPVLSPEVQRRLFPYFSGAFQVQESPAIQVGGYVDHAHVLFRLSKNTVASTLVGEVKGESSKWLKTEFAELSGFSWQAGYGLFSVSASQVEVVKEYIAKQEEHHRTRTFQDEYRELLQRYGVEYDEQYVWG